jgi:hypothetical protein
MERSLAVPIRELAFSDHKMAMVSGPRQCGKTTLGRMLLDERKVGAYHNWDDVTFRRAWTKAPQTMIAELTTSSSVPLIVLDEIHKARGWKRTLKGMYDTREKAFDLIVTGSARLNVYKKGGDSPTRSLPHVRGGRCGVGRRLGGRCSHLLRLTSRSGRSSAKNRAQTGEQAEAISAEMGAK